MMRVPFRAAGLVAFAVVAASGCASINELPTSASQLNFTPDAIGKTGWSQYQDVMFVRGIDRDTAFLAAKAGLANSTFTIKKASLAEGYVLGSRGMTAYDWNVVAGVYFAPEKDGYVFKVIAQGSRDFGFWGDHTDSSWPQDIFKGVREYILTESQIDNPDRDVFQVRSASGEAR